MIINMLLIGILLIIFGVFAIAYGIVQNTILHMMFAGLNERLARFNTEQGLTDIFLGPGLTEIIVGIIAIITGIVLIVIYKKKKRQWLEQQKLCLEESEEE